MVPGPAQDFLEGNVETCPVCHRPGKLAEVELVHDEAFESFLVNQSLALLPAWFMPGQVQRRQPDSTGWSFALCGCTGTGGKTCGVNRQLTETMPVSRDSDWCIPANCCYASDTMIIRA